MPRLLFCEGTSTTLAVGNFPLTPYSLLCAIAKLAKNEEKYEITWF